MLPGTNGQTHTKPRSGPLFNRSRLRESVTQGARSKIHSYTSCNTSERVLFFPFFGFAILLSIQKDLRFLKVKIKAIEKFLKEIYQNYRSYFKKNQRTFSKSVWNSLAKKERFLQLVFECSWVFTKIQGFLKLKSNQLNMFSKKFLPKLSFTF